MCFKCQCLSVGNHWVKRKLLHLAVEHGAPAYIITRLISPDNINMQARYGETALSLAASKKRWDLVPVLLAHGADINLGQYHKSLFDFVHLRKKVTPLHLAVEHGAPADIITRLISPDNINKEIEVDEPGYYEHHDPEYIITPLFSFDNINKEIEEVKYWRELTNSFYRTPLSLAVSEKRWELVPVLLQHGADVNFAITYRPDPRDFDLCMCNIYSKTYVLYEAVMEKRWDLVPVLLQHGADVNVRHHHTAQSCPPYMYLHCGNDDCFLCQRNIKITFDDKTSLHLAVEKDAPSHIVAQLISPYNINLGTANDSNKTAIKMAFDKKRWDLVHVLLQHGADVNLCNTWSLTQSSLLEAVQHGAPADIIAQMTLQMALKEKRWDLVPILLQQVADPSTALEILRRKKQVLHEMVQNKRWEMIEILLQYGADPATLDSRQSQEPVVLSLKAQSISTIRSHMPVKSDKAYEGLGLPGRLVDEVKLKPQAKAICGVQITRL